MNVSLGIDTGGTYTDAALVNQTTGEVLASAKALTTHDDLSVGIRNAIAAVLSADGKPFPQHELNMVSLSTTLATNAIAEGYGGYVCLLLIGYDENLMRQYNFHQHLVTDDVVYLRGGHDIQGNEVAPLDEDAARQAILARRSKVEAFAVSGYFGVRNPDHELRTRVLVEGLTGLPVTCGHELTGRLNAVRRATTVALNAQLISLLQELIARVGQTLEELSITAPLMVVKGDGSLVRAGWAIQRPIETILSGPAASAVGALNLTGRRDVWVVDMGGTTTDIMALRNGRPILNPDGARVGGTRTMVEAVDVHTAGLGGDSHVRLGREGQLRVGPRRVVPLCVLADRHPDVLKKLRRPVLQPFGENPVTQFLIPWRHPSRQLSDRDMALLSRAMRKPLALSSSEMRDDWMFWQRIESLEKRRLVQRAAFAPTDALHALGSIRQWNGEASRLGAELLASQCNLSTNAFCEKVIRCVSNQVVKELVSKILEAGSGLPEWEKEPTAASLMERALADENRGDLGCNLELKRPLVAVGAPVNAYMPRAAARLHTELLIPAKAEVANAVGAVAGGVIQHVRVLISPLNSAGRFRLYLPDGVRDFEDLEEAVRYANQAIPPYAEALARRAGAEQVEVRMAREDRRVRLDMGGADEIYLQTALRFTAVGRPGVAAQ